MRGLFGEACKYWPAARLKMEEEEKKVCLLTVFPKAGVPAQLGDYLRKDKEDKQVSK